MHEFGIEFEVSFERRSEGKLACHEDSVVPTSSDVNLYKGKEEKMRKNETSMQSPASKHASSERS